MARTNVAQGALVGPRSHEGALGDRLLALATVERMPGQPTDVLATILGWTPGRVAGTLRHHARFERGEGERYGRWFPGDTVPDDEPSRFKFRLEVTKGRGPMGGRTVGEHRVASEFQRTGDPAVLAGTAYAARYEDLAPSANDKPGLLPGMERRYEASLTQLNDKVRKARRGP